MIERASELLGVNANTLKEFSVDDTFNNNTLEGVICSHSSHRYGALVLFKVNNVKCEQIIYCTPKLEYPFNKNGDFIWPKITQIEAWDKLDGTNILAYWYKCKGKEYCTFKTRLTPVLSDGPFGGFKSMWSEYIADNDWVMKVIDENRNYNLSFEMYGSRNPITVSYDIPLEVSLLFGVRREDHSVRPPSQLSCGVLTKLPKQITIDSKKDLTQLYEDLKVSLSAQNNREGVFFVEGIVLYAFCNQPSWRQFKCKPEEIQKIHWGTSALPMRELWNTALNSFESGDSTKEEFLKLLEEEYTKEQIGKSEQRINKVYYEARIHMEFISKVNRIWSVAKKEGFDIMKDKGDTFRFISKYFDKKDMKKVGTVILKQAGLT